MNYVEDFEVYRDDASQDIKGIANATSKGAFSRALVRMHTLTLTLTHAARMYVWLQRGYSH